jgi:hypothetical protein
VRRPSAHEHPVSARLWLDLDKWLKEERKGMLTSEVALKRCGVCRAWHGASLASCPNCRAHKIQVIRRASLIWCAILGVFLVIGACVMLDLD